jgi:UDP-N-acetylglucosamine 2-epimerase (hydrolysing)
MVSSDLRRIVFVSGTRADFGKLKPLMRAVENASGFECHIFATGMHLMASFGYTFQEIQKSGFTNVFPCYNQTRHSTEFMDFVLADTIHGLGHYVRELEPDLIVVHGDRVETLAGAISGALNNVLVAHVEGGELSGTVDGMIRHAVSKLAHVHYVANEDARRRLLQLGEPNESIFIIGSPDIDIMLSDTLPSLEEVRKRYEIDFPRYGILLYHSVTTELDTTRRNIAEVIAAVIESGHNFVVIHPNNDSGSRLILESLASLENKPHFRLLPSLRFEYFLTLLKNADFILGNSSAGVREAPVYAVPSINVGTRQNQRFHYESILNVPEDRQAILKALKRLPTRLSPNYHFGRGNSALRFMESICKPDLWKIPTQKQFQDLPYL